MKIIYEGTTKGGTVKMYRRSEFSKDVLADFPECDIYITVEKKKKKRSCQQNAYYWSVVVPMCKEGFYQLGTECSTLDVHEFLKDKFIRVERVNLETGEIEDKVGSTTDLSTTGMMDFIAQVQRFATEFLGIYIPDPNEQITIEL